MNKPIALPRLITFTGVDDWTDPLALVDLAEQYPVEFGVLMIPKPSATRWPDRYPTRTTIERLFGRGLRLSAHLCGQYAADALQRSATPLDGLLSPFTRAQINTAGRSLNFDNLAFWRESVGFPEPPILQCRDSFPQPNEHVSWLFDASGGRGITPGAWPAAPDCAEHLEFVGYAGGLRDSNAAQAVAVIGRSASSYWIDMESGVRTGERFDVSSCKRVCEIVFDAPAINGTALAPH